jgi:hypothetical protein
LGVGLGVVERFRQWQGRKVILILEKVASFTMMKHEEVSFRMRKQRKGAQGQLIEVEL